RQSFGHGKISRLRRFRLSFFVEFRQIGRRGHLFRRQLILFFFCHRSYLYPPWRTHNTHSMPSCAPLLSERGRTHSATAPENALPPMPHNGGTAFHKNR